MMRGTWRTAPLIRGARGGVATVGAQGPSHLRVARSWSTTQEARKAQPAPSVPSLGASSLGGMMVSPGRRGIVLRRAESTPLGSTTGEAPREEDSEGKKGRGVPKWMQAYTDEQAEARRLDVLASLFRSEVYTFEDWEEHKSSRRYFSQLRTMLTSSTYESVFVPALLTALFALVVCLLDEAVAMGMAPTYLSAELPILPFNLTSGSLALLLVFRTNSAYGRWWEARAVWEGGVNRVRDITRQGLMWFDEEDMDLKQDLVKWAVAYLRCLKNHLRKEGRSQEGGVMDLYGWLPDAELKALKESGHRPLFCLMMLSEVCNAADLQGIQILQMNNNMTFLQDTIGKCERILRTPIPASYTRHTGRFLALWVFCLPLGLHSQLGWASIPVSFFIAFTLLGIEEIGIEIEEPFSILSLEVMCDTAQQNCVELLGGHMSCRDLVAKGRLAYKDGEQERRSVEKIRAISVQAAKARGIEVPGEQPYRLIVPESESVDKDFF